MVNNKFYETINELVARATNGVATKVVDYRTFVDAGQQLSQANAAEWRNNFVDGLINRIARLIIDARSYNGAYSDLVRGSLMYGNTIELIMYNFYDAQIAPFVDLTNGESVDQYVVNKPDVIAGYYIKSNAFSVPITIQRDQLMKAFTSPAEMDSFISGVITYVMNSVEFQRESGRIGMVADFITRLNALPGVSDDENKPGIKYNLVTLYNAKAGTSLNADNALYNSDFVKFAVSTINKVSARMARPSTSYNIKGRKTFTRDEDKHTFVHIELEAAIDAYVPRPYLNNEQMRLKDYISVPYWQNENSPLTVSSYSGDAASPTVSDESVTSRVICVLADKMALGEYLKDMSTENTPYNAAGKYWNMWTHVETRYVINEYANSVMFTLD